MKKTILGVFAVIVFAVLCWKNLYLFGLIPLDGNVLRWAYPRWTLFHAALHTPGLLLWNPFYNMGEPLLADPQSLVAYPISWLLAPLSSFLRFFQSWVALHTAGAATAMGLLSWRRHKDGYSAVAAGGFFVFNGFFLSRANLPGHFASAAWLPVLLYTLDRGSSLGLGAALALQWTAGFPPFSCISVLCVLGLAVWKGPSTRRCLAWGSVIALGLCAYQWIPFREMLGQSNRSLWLPAEIAAQNSIPPGQLLKELLLPQWYAFSPGVTGDPAIVSFYAGPIALALAAFAIIRGRRPERWLAGVIGLSFLLSLGNFLPGYSRVSFLHLFRFPANWLLVGTTGIAWLCGEGIHHLKKQRWKQIGLAILAADLLMFAQYTRTAWSSSAFLTEKPELAQSIQESPARGRIFHSIALEQTWTAQGTANSEEFQLLKDFLIPSYGTSFAIPEGRSYQVLRSRRAEALQKRLEIAERTSPLWNAAGISTVVRLAPGATRVDRNHFEIWQNKRPSPLLYMAERSQGSLRIGRVRADSIEAEAELKQPGIVVFRQVDYPGWEARIDGARVSLQLFEDTFMAVLVAAGKHTLVFTYNPDSFRLGMTVSLMTLLGILGLLGVRTYKRIER